MVLVTKYLNDTGVTGESLEWVFVLNRRLRRDFVPNMTVNTSDSNPEVRWASPVFWRVVAVVVVFILVVTTVLSITGVAGAQDLYTDPVLSRANQDEGELWKARTDGVELGNAWLDESFNDSSWQDMRFRHYERSETVPKDYGYYLRKEVEITDIYQVVAIEAELFYDDAAVLFLNGVEVYRTVRGNLPDDPSDDEISIYQNVVTGGAEQYYVPIPGIAQCEARNPCANGKTEQEVPAIDPKHLVEGTNVLGIMVWNRNDSTDIGADLDFQLIRDLSIPYPAPVFGAIEDRSSKLADNVNYRIDATSANGAITYQATSLPPGLSLDASSGTITGQPTRQGAYTVTLTATDPKGSSTETFRWTVTNAPPQITPIGAQQSPVGVTTTLRIQASDPDGGALKFSATGLPNGFTLDPATGVISGTASAAGAFSTTVSVTDDENETKSITFPWQIAQPPIDLTTPDQVTTAWGANGSTRISASDPTGAPVTLTVQGAPPGVVFAASTGVLSGTPTAPGIYTVVVSASSSSGKTVGSFPWTVENGLPNITGLSYRSLLERLRTEDVTISATDPDGGQPTLAVTGLPPGMSFAKQTGVISGVPTTPGVYRVSVTATDDEGGTRTQNATWTIVDVVDKPVRINEVVASNDKGLSDADGDFPDWIELHNPTTLAIDLSGWKLRDASSTWQFPSISIPAGGYLIVFADDKDRVGPNGELHANFKISKEGDKIELVEASVVDAIGGDEGLPRQMTDVSYGVGPDGNHGYLQSPTPRAANTGFGQDFPPVLRPFSDRMYNLGEEVTETVDAFDPDGDTLTYQATGIPPGVSFNTSTGEFSGAATRSGTFGGTLTVIDADGRRAQQDYKWIIVDAPYGPSQLVLNEYNAVAPNSEFIGGQDEAFGPTVGNGGDWFEFLVVQDGLDIRNWTIELWDRDKDDLLGAGAKLVFADDELLASLPAGTIITVSEDVADDPTLDPARGDWWINLQSNNDDDGAFFTVESQESFNSTRANQNIIIRDAQGRNVTPAVGETERWDAVAGGVGDGEVMSLCAEPTQAQIVTEAAYVDNATKSTFGAPNTCRLINDPTDPDDDVIFTQSLADIRRAAQVSYAALKSTCVRDDGRWDVVVSNYRSTTLTYTLSLPNMTNRQVRVAPNEKGRLTVTGRPDGEHRIQVSDGSMVVASFSDAVDCDRPLAVTSSCLAANGRIDVQLVNDGTRSATFAVSIGQIERSKVVAAGTASRVTVTGRPDGTYPIVVERDGQRVRVINVSVDCDP